MGISASTRYSTAGTTNTASGSANNVSKTGVVVPPGALVFFSGVVGAVNNTFTSVADGAGTKYTLVQAAAQAVIFPGVIAYGRAGNNGIPVGTAYTCATSGAAVWV